ncbi:MAG: RimJ/RimL family protein N-acetyltransferase [Ilumatobacter sp.]|jgi:RimJ/RimL family protein N-acetyltransferase
MATELLRTDRLDLRRPVEADRSVFVDLFCRDDFMVFSGGTLSAEASDARFDVMLKNGSETRFAKQPVVRRDSGQIVGYCGVAWFDFEGQRRHEFGYRFISEARGYGYATEAGKALLDLAAESFDGELIAMIDPTNVASKRVAVKLGFEFWKLAEVNDCVDEIYRLQVVKRVHPTAG